MIWLYRLLFPVGLVLVAPFQLWHMRRRGGYRRHFSHRFGATPPLPPKTAGVPRVWLQAVSVGEMLAIGPVLEGLRAGGAEIYLTTTTSTGYAVARERYLPLVAALGYFPVDWWPFSRRAWARVAPDLVLLAESERWPEHLAQARARGVPVVCVNARLSDRSHRRMCRLRPLAAGLLFDGVTRVLAASAQDAARFKALGVPADRVTLTGSLKLDVAIPLIGEVEKAKLRAELGLPPAGLVLMGSSTWPGEEAALVQALLAARGRGLAASLLLVPRHAERRDEVRTLLERTGLRFHFRLQGAAPGGVDVAVADTTGELRKLTQLADVVFIGKSLAPHEGGQTPVEAAVLGRPILHGPRMSNFREIARSLDTAGAALEVAHASALVEAAVGLLGDPARRERMSAAARAWSEASRGAGERTLAALREELAKAGSR
jgi:3-deoxy-D-manno-octulosonic-acid transferase